MNKKIFAEVGFGNDSFLSTEIEEGDSEYRINKFILPNKIRGFYFRLWVFKIVFILSSNQGFKIQKKKKKKFKILFGISGEGYKKNKDNYFIKEYSKHYIGKTVNIKIDRPVNSKHPKYGFVYEVNYGFIPNTNAPDGEEIDVYLLSVYEEVKEYVGKCIAIIHRINDEDDKLIVVSSNVDNISDKEIMKRINFQEKWFEYVIVR